MHVVHLGVEIVAVYHLSLKSSTNRAGSFSVERLMVRLPAWPGSTPRPRIRMEAFRDAVMPVKRTR
jgi:hypothetical protein